MMKSGAVSLRRLRDDEADYRLLEAWCGLEAVYRYFEQRILTGEEIRRKYRPRTREDARVPVFMIERDGCPVGIIQYQRMSAEDNWCGIEAEDGYEIDLFIGEEKARGRGIGRESVGLIVRYLFERMGAGRLVMCPMSENVSAIRCYKRCGFEETGRFRAPDTVGVTREYVRMVRFRPDKPQDAQ